MSVWSTLGGWADDAISAIAGLPGDISNAVQKVWHVAVEVARVLDWVIRNPFLATVESLAYLSALFTGNTEAMRNVALREHAYIFGNEIQPLRAQVIRWLAQLRARIAYLFAQAYLYIDQLYAKSLAYTRQQVAIEHKAMLQAFAAAEAYTRRLVSALHSTIEKETSSGYSATLRDRATLVSRIADTIATRNPAVRTAVSEVIRIILDLLAVDDPLARLAATFLLREVIDRLGIDKAAGVLLADVAGPLLADPRPKGLHDVIGNMGLRLDALESQWATFMGDGGPQVLQAGREWKNITSLLADAGMLAFFGGMVAAPAATAADTAAVLSGVIRETGTAVTALLD